MTDEIKVPISAPGSQQASQGILKVAAAVKQLMLEEEVMAAETKKFNDLLVKEAGVLSGQVSPALKRAREDARAYNDMMKRGQLAQGRSFLAGSSLGNGSGPGNELDRSMIQQGGKALARIGGDTGRVFQTLSMAAGGLGLGFGALAVGVVGTTMVVNALMEKEQKRLDLIGEEVKLREDFNKVMKESKEGQENNSKSSFKDLLQARRYIAAVGTGGIGKGSSQDMMEKLEKTGDPEVFKAMVKFMRSRQGQRVGFDKALNMANEMAATGLTTVSGALDTMGSTKGRLDIDRMLGKEMGGRKTNEWFRGEATSKVKMYEDYYGYTDANDKMRKAGTRSMEEGRDKRLFMPSVMRDFDAIMDPAGTAAGKFTKGLEDALKPMQAMADAQSEIIKQYKESGFFGLRIYGKTKQEELDIERKKIDRATR